MSTNSARRLPFITEEEHQDARQLGAKEIVDGDTRHSTITSHTIGVPELATLLEAVPSNADLPQYEHAVLVGNVLGLATENGRFWRYKTLRRIYGLRRSSVLFRALRDLWPGDPIARPLLATLCALATDTVLRATSPVITRASPGDPVTANDFGSAIDRRFPGAYAVSTLEKAAHNAYASWQQSGHLSPPERGQKRRQRVAAQPASTAYALFLGHLQGLRGQALFGTLWAEVLDQAPSELEALAFAASQRGMLEYRNAGGVIEISFEELLRPLEMTES